MSLTPAVFHVPEAGWASGGVTVELNPGCPPDTRHKGKTKKKKLKGGGMYQEMKDGGLFDGKVKTKGVGAATQGIHHKP